MIDTITCCTSRSDDFIPIPIPFSPSTVDRKTLVDLLCLRFMLPVFFPGYCEGPKCEGETNGNELSGFQCGCIRIGMGKSLLQVV